MRFSLLFITCFILSACIHKGSNPVDPYESYNRNVHAFNVAFDATMIKPVAKLYQAIVPAPVKNCVNNAYDNVAMLPSVINDVFQADWRYAIKDSWRFMINSTFGIGGLFDVADKHFNLPPHYNDLGITFAKWGDKSSPYLVLPLLGPSTIRDGMGLIFDYTVLSPYGYIPSDATILGLAGLRYVDLRARFLDTEKLMDEALDPYSFVRDAYLQHRNYLITGEQPPEEEANSLYVD